MNTERQEGPEELGSLTAVIARKDFEDAVQSKMLLSLTGILVVVVILAYGGVWWAASDPDPAGLAAILSVLFQLIVPLLAFIASYMSVVGERRSGSLKVLLSLPPERREVVFGKLIGRAGVIAAVVLLASLVSAALSAVLFRSVPVWELAGVTGATVLLGVAFVGIGVGVSAAVATRGRAMAGVIGFYLVCLLFWDVITAGVHRLVEGSLPSGPEYEAWYLFTQWLNPINAHAVLLDAVLEANPPNFTIVIFGPFDAADLETHLAGEAPVFLQDWVPVVVFGALFALPPVLGYLRFRGVDLG